ncbi:hypothetical protein ColTof4_13561 [Colletotrichum tofieldiae]|nr:hypothetical protein ColTof4_13561 [Colletotrichum tofieldiae]GKT97348.1 hypothetical protein Ct61P_15198 [Colletotrichum tofieldiae]
MHSSEVIKGYPLVVAKESQSIRSKAAAEAAGDEQAMARGVVYSSSRTMAEGTPKVARLKTTTDCMHELSSQYLGILTACCGGSPYRHMTTRGSR